MKKRRRIALGVIWTLPSAVFLTLTAIVYWDYRIPPPDRLDDAARTAVMTTLRAAVEGKPDPGTPISATIHGPVVATVWSAGRPVVRVDAEGSDLGASVRELATELRGTALGPLAAADREKARIQVDIVTGTAPLGGNHWLLEHVGVGDVSNMMAINSGVEGIGVVIAGKTTVLLPYELVASKLLAAKKPSEALSDFAMGVDLMRIRTLVMNRSAQKTPVAQEDLFRFRTDTFVEQPAGARDKPPLQLYRGIPAAPKLSAKVLREHALEGGRFLVAHLSPVTGAAAGAPNGRYIYEHELNTGTMTDPRSASYSMPRHAGTTYFLAELYRITKEPWLREPIERAFSHLADLMANGKCTGKLPDGTEIDCVLDKNEKIATLGSTALAVVAFAEYQRATGDTRYLPTVTRLAAWILWLQRPDGSFRHRYEPATKTVNEEAQDLYYSGEAALAMARMYTITKDMKYARSSEAALDWLVGWYDYFMTGFFYGEEHWTCIASEALSEVVMKPAYRDFCHGYGAFLRNQQAQVGEHPDEDDFAGAYNFTPFLVPHNTPAGSRTEAMISSYLLGRKHGTPDADIRGQIHAALQYALGQQIRPENDFNVVGPGMGGMPSSPIDRNVRIDYVQHVCSAFIRASEWIDDEP